MLVDTTLSPFGGAEMGKSYSWVREIPLLAWAKGGSVWLGGIRFSRESSSECPGNLHHLRAK